MNFMSKQRTINVSLPLCRNSIIFGEVECLAFALMVKHKFVNSTINNPSIRNLKQMFHIGQDKLKRILKTSLERNYISYDSCGRLIAMPVYDTPSKKKDEPHFFFHIKMTDGLLCRLNEKSDLNKIKTYERFIRESVLLNQTKKATNIGFDLRTSKLRHRSRKATSLKRKCHTSEAKKNLSLARIGEILKCGRYSARKIINSLVKSELVIRSCQNIFTGIECDDRRKDVSLWYNLNANRGFYFAYDGKVYLHLSNIYDYNVSQNSNIIFIKTPKN